MKKIKLNKSDPHIDGKIQLLLTGFHQQDIISIDEIIYTIKKLPTGHLAGLKKISYDPSRLHQMLYYYVGIAPNLSSLGEFIQKKRQVNMYKFRSKPQFYHTLYHEIGHYVYFFVIDSALKKHWATQLHRKGKFISDYASKNAAEDFAECYSFYMTNKHKLAQINVKYHFMQHEIFQNQEHEPPQDLNLTF